MTEPMTIPTKTPRLEAVDALRGFAIMAILLVHSLEHFIYPVYPENPGSLDQGILTVTFSLFAGKAYAIFALLFGFTFYVQYVNQQMKGRDFGPRFLWRLLLLAGLATLNAAFFPGGDVLLLFAVVGIVLFVVRKWSDKAVLAVAVVCLLQPVEWYQAIASRIAPSYKLPLWNVGDMYGQLKASTASGDWGDFLRNNITLGQKASLLWAVNAGRFMQTAGLFMLGMLAGRRQLFAATEASGRFWVKTLIVCAVLFCPLYQLNEAVSAGAAAQTAGVILDMWQKLAFTGVLAASFMLLYRSAAFRELTSGLRLYGRMSLSNYIGQSVAGALIYFPIGLNLAPYCGYALSFLIGVALFFLQLALCKWWLKKHRQGPLEWLWHKLTWIDTKRK